MVREWKDCALGELIDVKHGFAFPGEFIHDEPRGDILLTPGNFAIGGGFKGDKFKYYDGPVPDDFVLTEGDLLVTMTDLSKESDTLGLPAFVPSHSEGRRYLHNQRLGKVLLRAPNVLDRTYLHYRLRAADYRHEILAGATGTAIKHTSPERIKRFRFLRPSLSEQHAISAILGTLDDKIELNRRMSETLEAMARALFESWFVDFDPVRAKAEGRDHGLPKDFADLFPVRLVDSELGQVPEGWYVSSVGEIARSYGGIIQTGPFGSQLHAADYVVSGIPVVMPRDISRRRISTEKIARAALEDAVRLDRHRLQEGDIVYSRRGDVERHAIVSSREAGWLCGTGCLLVRFGRSFPSPLFVSLFLDQPDSRAWIVRHAIGATMPNLNTGILARIPMLKANDVILTAFDRFVRPLEGRMLANEREIETLAALRDALLPKLISGELRVKEAEKLMGGAA
jgi:type I restriction enzyme S subunit